MSYLHWLLPHKYLANLLADQLRISHCLCIFLCICICMRVKSQFRSVRPPPPPYGPRTSLCPQRICRKQIKFKSQIKNKLTNVHKGGKGGAEEGAEGKQKTQQQLSAVSSGDTPPIHTQLHTPTDQHTLLCVLSALCGLFLEKFSFMMSVRDRVIITEHTTQKLRRNVYKDVCECASVCVRLCVCVWRPYNNQHLSRLDALLNW